MITIATDRILRFYFSGVVPQEDVIKNKDQVNNHALLFRESRCSLTSRLKIKYEIFGSKN